MKSKFTDRLFAGILILAGIFIITLTGAAVLSNFSIDGSKAETENSKTTIHLRTNENLVFSGDSITEYEEDRIVTYKKDENGNMQKFEILLDKGTVADLYVDEIHIPSEEISHYKELIKSTLEEVRKARMELEKAENELAGFDAGQLEEEIDRARREMKKIRTEEIQQEAELSRMEAEKEIKEARKELEEARVEMEMARAQSRAEVETMNWDSINHIVDSSLHTIDWEEIKLEVNRALKEAQVEIDDEELQRTMQEAEKTIQLSMQAIEKAMQKGMEEAIKSLENIDWDMIGESIEMSLKYSSEALQDLDKTIARIINETGDIDPVEIEMKIEDSRNRIEKEREKLEMLEEELEKAVEDIN